MRGDYGGLVNFFVPPRGLPVASHVPLVRLHAGAQDVAATFWLIDAPDSLRAQSHRNPDGAGVGTFGPAGQPEVSKQPIAAWEDAQFAAAAT